MGVGWGFTNRRGMKKYPRGLIESRLRRHRQPTTLPLSVPFQTAPCNVEFVFAFGGARAARKPPKGPPRGPFGAPGGPGGPWGFWGLNRFYFRDAEDRQNQS